MMWVFTASGAMLLVAMVLLALGIFAVAIPLIAFANTVTLVAMLLRGWSSP